MTKSVEQVLISSALYVDESAYRMLRLPANGVTLAAGVIAEAGLPFSALVVDKDEVTLLLREDAYENFGERLRFANVMEQRYRLITFEEALEPDLIGFIARIGAALANAGVPILVFAAYSRDHIFVPAERLSSALDALVALRDACKQGR